MGASCSAMMGWLGVPKARLKWSILVETRERHMMRLATKAGSATPSAMRRPSPPQVTPVVGAHGGSHLPVKGIQQIMIVQDCARTRASH